MAFLQRTDAVRLYYEVHGDEGPWVTLLNGHTRASSDFRLLAGRLGKNPARVLLLDHRGAGKTQAPLTFTFTDMVDDVMAIWQELGIARSHLLGISMGGMLASWLACHAQTVVEHLVLISTAKDLSYLQGNAEPWPEDLPGVERKLARYVTPAFQQRNALLWKAMAKGIWQEIQRGDFLARAAAQRQALDSYEAAAVDYGRIVAPSLIVHGGKDAIIPVAAAYDLATAIKGAQLCIWQEEGHLLLAERSNDLSQLVSDFFQGKLAGIAAG